MESNKSKSFIDMTITNQKDLTFEVLQNLKIIDQSVLMAVLGSWYESGVLHQWKLIKHLM